MHQMMISSYHFDEYSTHERGIKKGKRADSERVCTKKPTDMRYARCVLASNPEVYFIYVVRDPRDVICSRLPRKGNGYYTNLRVWRDSEHQAVRLRGHPRFIEVKYEDLVHDPASVQHELEQRMPFLERKADFARFPEDWAGDPVAEQAMNGVRAPDPGSVGRWREHIPRVSRQVATHGRITPELAARGYEVDASWEAELESAEAASDSVLPDRIPLWATVYNSVQTVKRCLSYRLKLKRGLLGYHENQGGRTRDR
jgi:hypothetical protein